jgi:hypothetical protein
MNKFILVSLLLLLPCVLISQKVSEESTKNEQSKVKDLLYVNLNVFLEGPFEDGKMLTDLNKSNLIPLDQPYNVQPWNYDGTESVESIPNGNIVDWVYIELRNGLTPEEATSENIFGKQAGFLLNSGKVVSTDGASSLVFDTTYT